MSATIDRSALFTVYNVARGMVADTGRLNRALGIAMRKEPRPYTTTATWCSCPDFTFNRQPCKHMLAAALKAAAL